MNDVEPKNSNEFDAIGEEGLGEENDQDEVGKPVSEETPQICIKLVESKFREQLELF